MLTIEQYHAELRASNTYLAILAVVSLAVLVQITYLSRRWRRFPALPIPLPYLPIPIILALAFLIRLPRMFDSLWYDETYTAMITRVAWPKLPAVILSDVHPPLWYTVEWLIGRILGTGELALRLPALAAGLWSIWLFYRLALAADLPIKTAQLAALLLALLPTHIFYSTEARSYALLTALIFLAILAILKNRPSWFMVTGLLPFLHAHGYVYLALLSILALAYNRFSWHTWLPSIYFAGFEAALYLPFALYQAQDVNNGFWMDRLSIGGALWYIPFSGTMTRNAATAPGIITLVLIYPFTALALWRCRSWLYSNTGLILASVWFGIPALVGLISVLWRPVYLVQALMPAGLLVVLVWAKFLADSPPRFAYAARNFAALVLIFSWLTGYRPKENVRRWFQDCQDSDYTYAVTTIESIMALYYSPVPVVVYPYPDNRDQFMSQEARDAVGFVLDYPVNVLGNLCLMDIYNPSNTEQQRRIINALLRNGYTASLKYTGPFETITMYRIANDL